MFDLYLACILFTTPSIHFLNGYVIMTISIKNFNGLTNSIHFLNGYMFNMSMTHSIHFHDYMFMS